MSVIVEAGAEFAKIRTLLTCVVARCAVLELRDVPAEPGVYFLLEQGEIVYVGQSQLLTDRWAGHEYREHVRGGRYQLRWMQWDEANFASPIHQEALFVAALRPKRNAVVSGCKL